MHSLKQELAELIPKKQNEIKELKAKYKDTVIGDVTVDQIYGGMRDIKALVTETSLLDANEVRSVWRLARLSKEKNLFLHVGYSISWLLHSRMSKGK